MASPPRGRIIVTGSNGFIGRQLVVLALAQGWSVTALARDIDWLTQLDHPHLTVVRWNIEDVETSRDVFQDADAIFHLAAFIPPDHTQAAYAQKCLEINGLGTLRLLDIARQANARRFVYFGGGNCYLPLDRLATESDPLYPAHRATFYLVSKIVGEVYAEHYRLNHGMAVTCLRISSPYGPTMSEKSLIMKLVRQLRQGSPVEIHDGGRYMVDFVYLDDVVQAALRAVEQKADGIFNIGSGGLVSTLDLARRLADLCGAPPHAVVVHPPSGNAASTGYAGLDISKARSTLGYDPVALDTGLRLVIAAQAGQSNPA